MPKADDFFKVAILRVLTCFVLLFGLGRCETYDDNASEAFDTGASVDHTTLERLSPNDRTAVMLEAFYALDPSHNGGSSHMINGWSISGWNYLNTDTNALNVMKGRYGACSSMWYDGRIGAPNNGTCSAYIRRDGATLYNYPGSYGYYGGHGRGGQCKFFANLLLYRSGVTTRTLPTYSAALADYNGPRRYTKPYSRIEVGDILFRTDLTHTAVVVAVLGGTPGSSVNAVDVVDSNLVTNGGIDQEIIARHIIDRSGRWGSYYDLNTYFAVDLNGPW